MRVALLLVAVVGAVPLAAQQPARLTGTVVDSGSGRPVAGAEVFFGADARVTSPAGQFHFGSVESGTLRLRVRALGYRAVERDVEILPGSEQRIELRIAALAIELDSVVIRTTATASLSGPELERRGSTLAAALDGWEGIVVSRTGAGDEAIAQVRGSAADEVLVLINGFPANNAFTGRADLGRLYSRDVERVSLERGAQGAKYGSRAVAGVISIQSRRSGGSLIGGGVGSFGAMESHGALGSPNGRIAFSMAELADGFEYAMPGGGTASRENAGGTVYSLNARYGRRIDVTFRGSLANRGLSGTIVNPTPAARSEERTAFLGISTGGRLLARASVEWLSTRARDTAPPPGFTPYDAATTGVSGTGSMGFRHRMGFAGWSGDVSWTGDVRHDQFDGDAVVDGAHFNRIGLGAAATLEHPAGASTWSVSPAVRLDWWSGRESPAASARVDLQWTSSRTSVTLSGGSSVTAPALADVLFRESVGVEPNPDLRPERVRFEVEGGIRQQLRLGSADATVRLTGFWGTVDDMILWTPVLRFTWTPGNFDVLRRGGEAVLDLRLPAHLSISAGTNLAVVTYRGVSSAQVRYRPRYTHTGEIRWAPASWDFALRWHYLGTRFTTNVGTNPLPASNIVSLSVERRLGHLLALQAEVHDLLDERTTYIAGYPTPGRAYHLSVNLEFP
jgi:iron complex outermembrane receptor protein